MPKELKNMKRGLESCTEDVGSRFSEPMESCNCYYIEMI